MGSKRIWTTRSGLSRVGRNWLEYAVILLLVFVVLLQWRGSKLSATPRESKAATISLPSFAPSSVLKTRNKNVPSLPELLGPCGDWEVKEFPSFAASLTPRQANDELMGSEGGKWNGCTHLEIYGLNFPHFLARYISLYIKPKRVLEFGCGLGTSADFIARFTPGGAQVICIEPEPMFGEIFNRRPWPFRPAQLAVDLFSPQAGACVSHLPALDFDLVYSFEVAEHLPLEAHEKLADILTSLTKGLLIFSAARVDQAGHGHIGGRSKEEWVNMFLARGLIMLPDTTHMASETAYRERSYDIYSNVMAFRNPNYTYTETTKATDPALGNRELYPSRFDMGSVGHAYIEGMDSALWPEIDYYLKLMKSKHLKCA